MQTVGYFAGIPLAIVVAGIFADRATKDFTANMDGLLFTSPLKEWQFATGRMIASFFISLMISLGLGLGLLLGSALPWMAPERIGPTHLLSYLQPYLYSVIPNIVIFGLLSFALGLLTRRTLTSYLVIVGLWFATSIITAIFSLLNLDQVWSLVAQPLFPSNQIDYAVRFWTKIEQNTLMVPFAPVIWLSRLIYLGLSLAFFAWVWRRFSFAGIATAGPNPRLERFLDWAEQRLLFRKTPSPPALPAEASPIRSAAVAAPTAHRHYGPGAQLQQGWRIALLLLCLSALFWVRGVDTQPQQRWRIARQRFTRPMQTVMGLSALTAVLLGGWSVYAKEGKLKFTYNVLGIHEFPVEASSPIPQGKHQVRMEFAYDGGGLAKGGNVTLYYDGQPVGSGRVEATHPMIFSADETTDIGYESGTPVSADYTAHSSKFTGKIHWVQLDVGKDDYDHLISPDERLRVAMARQ